jgi:hypothetical protein
MTNLNYGYIETGSDEWSIRQSQFEEFERTMWLDDSPGLKRSYPQHLSKHSQSIACLLKDGDIYWGLHNTLTNTSEVYNLDGKYQETLSLRGSNGWVNQQNCIEHDYIFLNLCEVY